MEWKKAIAKQAPLFEIPEEWLHIHYYEALSLLFRVENALRVFVYVVLKNELHEKWIDLNITSDDSEQATIKTISRKRMAQAGNFGYLGYSVNCPILHLTSGELIRLMVSDAYWKYFKQYFLGSKEIIKNKLDEIGAIRNSLAHFRPIKEDDVDVIKQNAKHVLIQVEKCLHEIITCNKPIPSNTTDDWYKELKTLGTDTCALTFTQSTDERWVKIRISYSCPILKHGRPNEWTAAWRVLNLKSSEILQRYPALSNLLIYAIEDVPYTPIDEKLAPRFKKDISILFSRDVISKEYLAIKKDLEDLLLTIANEGEMITQDNLASGQIIDSVVIRASLRKAGESSYWHLDSSPLYTGTKENDPPEYWGNVDFVTKDFISATRSFPWMPVEICRWDLPF